MSSPQQKMEILKRWLPGGTIKFMRDHACFVQISYKDVTVYIPHGLAHELQQTLLAIRDSQMQIDIEDYLRLGLPSSLEECREFQKRRKSANRAEQAIMGALLQEEQRRIAKERDLISEFFSDLTIQWEFVGLEEWTEVASGPDGSEEVRHTTPKFRYSLQWGKNSMSFFLSFEPREDEFGDEFRWLEASDVQGTEPLCDWRELLDLDALYYETEEEYLSGEKTGEIVPTWLDISRLILCLP